MYFLKSIVAGMVMMLMFAGGVFAQQQQAPQQQMQQPAAPAPDEISDNELQTFVDASDAIQPIQEQAQGEMQDAIEEEGIQLERFQEIMMAMQNPQMADQVNISTDEEQAIQQIQPKLMEIEMEASTEIRDVIADQGLDVERYQAIFMSLQQHPELMERLEVLLDE